MEHESPADYQRNRLRTIDNAMILIITLVSFALAGAEIILDSSLTRSLLPKISS